MWLEERREGRTFLTYEINLLLKNYKTSLRLSSALSSSTLNRVTYLSTAIIVVLISSACTLAECGAENPSGVACNAAFCISKRIKEEMCTERRRRREKIPEYPSRLMNWRARKEAKLANGKAIFAWHRAIERKREFPYTTNRWWLLCAPDEWVEMCCTGTWNE